jgi:hypothetical protein
MTEVAVGLPAGVAGFAGLDAPFQCGAVTHTATVDVAKEGVAVVAVVVGYQPVRGAVLVAGQEGLAVAAFTVPTKCAGAAVVLATDAIFGAGALTIAADGGALAAV